MAELSRYMRRLEATDAKLSDRKAKKILLNGVHQDIFESFIVAAA